jgi:hypothetical protein
MTALVETRPLTSLVIGRAIPWRVISLVIVSRCIYFLAWELPLVLR